MSLMILTNIKNIFKIFTQKLSMRLTPNHTHTHTHTSEAFQLQVAKISFYVYVYV